MAKCRKCKKSCVTNRYKGKYFLCRKCRRPHRCKFVKQRRTVRSIDEWFLVCHTCGKTKLYVPDTRRTPVVANNNTHCSKCGEKFTHSVYDNKETGEKEDLSKYENLDEIDIQYPEVNVSNSLLYNDKERLPQKINIKEGFANVNIKANNKRNNNMGKGSRKLIEREKVDCVSFIYKSTGVFIILVAILVILKLMKKI
mgnify:CR=1 FL=1